MVGEQWRAVRTTMAARTRTMAREGLQCVESRSDRGERREEDARTSRLTAGHRTIELICRRLRSQDTTSFIIQKLIKLLRSTRYEPYT